MQCPDYIEATAIVKMLRTILVVLFIFANCTRHVLSKCGKCLQSSSVACVSGSEFEVCYNGVPSQGVVSCPSNTVCTDDPAICLPTGTVLPACISQCGYCGTDLKFACLNETSYAFCFGATKPSNMIANCPSGLVCSNSDPPNFCVDPLHTAADCQVLATTAPPSVCTGPGRFPLPGNKDCKQYVYCFYNNFVLKAQIYTCQGTTIFYAPMQQCVRASDYPCII